VRALAEILRDVLLLGLVGACLWVFPKTVLTIEGVCGIGTAALFIIERHVR